MRGIAVAAITYWDFLVLVAVKLELNRAVGFIGIPLSAIPPILFFASTGAAFHISITRKTGQGQSWAKIGNHILQRAYTFVLAGFILTILLNERIDSWGLFEAIALTNIALYITLRFKLGKPVLVGLMLLSGALSPFLCAIRPTWPLPFSFLERMFIIGFFPFFPFFGYCLAGVLLIQVSENRTRLKTGLFFLLSGLALSIWIPILYDAEQVAYTFSMFLVTTGAVFLIFAALHRVADASRHVILSPLTFLGRHALGVTFWRKPLLYVPLLHLEVAERFSPPTAMAASFVLLVAIWIGSGILFAAAERIRTRRS